MKTHNQHQVDSYAFSDVKHLCQEVECARNRHQSHTHSSTEAETISPDAGLRMDGIPALDLWDLAIEVFHSQPHQINKSKGQESQGNLSRNSTLHMKNQNPTKHVNLHLNNVGHVSSYVRSSHFGAMLYRVLRYTVRFFFFPKKKLARFCCVNGAGSVAMLHHLVPERIPLQKPRNTFFFFEKKKKRLWTREVSVSLLPLMVRVALFYGTSRRTISRNTWQLSPNLIRYEPGSDDNLGWVHSHMSAVCLLVCVSAAENDWD